MSSAERLDLAAQLKVASNFVVAQYTETVDNRQGPPGPCNYFLGSEIEIRRMRDGKYNRLRTFQRRRKIIPDADVDQPVLIAEEARERVTRGGINILFLQLVPVFEIWIVDAHVRSHLGELADTTSEPLYRVSPTSCR